VAEEAKKTIKKVASKLKKASKAHAGQAKTLSAIELKKGALLKRKKQLKRNLKVELMKLVIIQNRD
jgi:hypothetical protein